MRLLLALLVALACACGGKSSPRCPSGNGGSIACQQASDCGAWQQCAACEPGTTPGTPSCQNGTCVFPCQAPGTGPQPKAG